MTIEDVEDHVRKYTVDAEEQLARQLRAIVEDCHTGQIWPVSVEVLRVIHRRLFDGVRSHAGCFRARAFGDEHLTFGPNRSVHRDRVQAELEAVFGKLDRSVASFAANQDAADYEQSAVHVAVWAHAEVVNSILVGLGLSPIAVEAVKQEYNEALNVYFRTKNLQVLVDLMLQLID